MAAARKVLIALGLIVLSSVTLGAALRRGRARGGDVRVGAIELVFNVQPERAAEVAFLGALDRFVGNLRAEGIRIGSVAPRPRSARVIAPGLEGAPLARALEGLPIHAHPATADAGAPGSPVAPTSPSAIEVSLDDEEAARASDAAMQQTARALRERVIAAHPCESEAETCAPSVIQREGALLVRLPLMDDITERRVKAAIAAPPALPAPLSLASERIVSPAAAP